MSDAYISRKQMAILRDFVECLYVMDNEGAIELTMWPEAEALIEVVRQLRR